VCSDRSIRLEEGTLHSVSMNPVAVSFSDSAHKVKNNHICLLLKTKEK
jgi:hypothetical protein